MKYTVKISSLIYSVPALLAASIVGSESVLISNHVESAIEPIVISHSEVQYKATQHSFDAFGKAKKLVEIRSRDGGDCIYFGIHPTFFIYNENELNGVIMNARSIQISESLHSAKSAPANRSGLLSCSNWEEFVKKASEIGIPILYGWVHHEIRLPEIISESGYMNTGVEVTLSRAGLRDNRLAVEYHASAGVGDVRLEILIDKSASDKSASFSLSKVWREGVLVHVGEAAKRSAIPPAFDFMFGRGQSSLVPDISTHKTGLPMEITEHKETLVQPNIISFDETRLEGRLHSFLLNGRKRELCEIRSPAGELLYFGVHAPFFLHRGGNVYAFRIYATSEIGVIPSLHKEHKVREIEGGEGGETPYRPILCSSWDDFLTKVEESGYFFPSAHFFPTSPNAVELPLSLTEGPPPISDIIDSSITSIRIAGENILVENSYGNGGRTAILELDVGNGLPFRLVRAWKDGLSVDLERDRAESDRRDRRIREQIEKNRKN